MPQLQNWLDKAGNHFEGVTDEEEIAKLADETMRAAQAVEELARRFEVIENA